ncbi:sporulation integral membrane protein YlbJ [Acetivibrio cellulolyticus]|uniref:sporulation integral membrane protein YlbJ n=1 Tax=Acetivibrio cellulolyticus TaxID=35830 RepID=UPI0001E2F621|nr:sporulation integral membrane protein YlbJ [Acetivibrio cellulolyticus]
MSLYTLVILIIIFVVIFYNFKSSRVIRLRPLLLPFSCITFILLLIIFSHTAVASASKGINLWLNVVFPSLFPFFVASEILNRTGFIKSVGILLEPIMRPLFNVPGCGSFALAMGVTSGYPVGAKLTASMREEKLLTKTEAERLLSFTNNSGPLFIIGAVAVGMFNNPGIGFVLLFCHILACLTVGILFRFYGKRRDQIKSVEGDKIFRKFKKELANTKPVNVGEVLGESIRNSINTMLAIGGFIILFSVIINLLLETGVIASLSNFLSGFLAIIGIPKDILTPILSGFFEITTGINMISKTEGISFVQQLAAVSLILGWAGLSVHFQVYSIISKTDISIKPYLFGKLIQGIFAAIYISIFMNLSFLIGVKSQSVFGYFTYNTNWTWYNYMLNSIKNMSASLILLFLMGLISFVVKRRQRYAIK